MILLDEATASLDVENETAVQAALSGLIKDKTVLIIAHRMRTVMLSLIHIFITDTVYTVTITGTVRRVKLFFFFST